MAATYIKRLVVALALTAAPLTTFAETLMDGRLACISKGLFDEAREALLNNDDREWQYLMTHGCIYTKGGTPVSVLEWSSSYRMIKIRAYVGNDSIILWTYSDAIQK